MGYCTAPQIEARVLALRNLANEDHVTNQRLVDEGIRWAQSQIDLCIGAYVATPLDTVPLTIEQIAADFAASFVLDGLFSGGGSDPSTNLAKEYLARARAALDHLCANGLSGLSSAQVVPDAASSIGVHTRHGNVITMESLARLWPR